MRRTQQALVIAIAMLCLGLGMLLQAGAHEGAPPGPMGLATCTSQ
jgi:hypothetical protein